MLDIGWAELLVVGVVALLVVGPKELPGLLRTIGRYVGMVRRQANEFKAQFDEAIRETELDEIRKEVDAIRNDTTSTIRDVEKSVDVGSVMRADADPGAITEDDPPAQAKGTETPAPVANGNGGATPEPVTQAEPAPELPKPSEPASAPRTAETAKTKPAAQAGA